MGRSTFAVSIVALAAACASVRPAQMAMDPNLASVAPLTFEGAGFGRTGDFDVGDWRVSFQRSDARTAIFDPIYERREGTLRFTLSGPDVNGALNGDCGARERTLTLGVFSKDVQPMAFACSFTHGNRPIPARLELQAARSNIVLPMQERRGEIALDHVVLSIRSIHAWEGSPLKSELPVGYEFRRDGVLIGAVELNGTPSLRLSPMLPTHERRAAVVAAVATGLLWDPAASSLGR